MATFSYFAYGSNMLTTRLQDRCGSAAVKTIAAVRGRRLSFSKIGKDGSGKATLDPAETGYTVIGVVFEIEESEADALHMAEGPGYECKDDFIVTCLRTGETLATRTYLAVHNDHTLKPYDWYLALVLAGIDEHRLGDDYAALYRLRAYDIDDDPKRNERIKAHKALERAGIPDYAHLLTATES